MGGHDGVMPLDPFGCLLVCELLSTARRAVLWLLHAQTELLGPVSFSVEVGSDVGLSCGFQEAMAVMCGDAHRFPEGPQFQG